MRPIWKVIAALGALVVVGTTSAGLSYAYRVHEAVQSPETVLASSAQPALTLFPSETTAVQQQTTIPGTKQEQKYMNIALYGLDTGIGGRDFVSVRTDTIMLIRINVTHPRIAALSIPRDTYAALPNGKKSKINAAFPYGGGFTGGGFQASNQAISNLSLLPVDHYIGIDMRAVPDLVDAMGGVDVRIDKPMVGHGLNYRPGTYHMNGKQALGRFVRYWPCPAPTAVRARFNPASLRKAHGSTAAARAVQKSIFCYLHGSNTGSTGGFSGARRKTPAAQMLFTQVPGNYWNNNGVSYWKPDPDTLQQTVAAIQTFVETGQKPKKSCRCL